MPAPILTTANVVLVASQFNVGIFSQFWLIKNGLFREEEFHPSRCAFLPVMAQVDSEDCTMMVIAERLQVVLKNPLQDSSPVAKVARIAELLPQTPYTAMGLNFDWDMTPGEQDVGGYTRAQFSVPGSRLGARFSAPDARFGGYFSQDWVPFRMKLDIKPVRVRRPGFSGEVVRFSFNFHMELSGAPDIVEKIGQGVGGWTAAFEEARSIVGLVG